MTNEQDPAIHFSLIRRYQETANTNWPSCQVGNTNEKGTTKNFAYPTTHRQHAAKVSRGNERGEVTLTEFKNVDFGAVFTF